MTRGKKLWVCWSLLYHCTESIGIRKVLYTVYILNMKQNLFLLTEFVFFLCLKCQRYNLKCTLNQKFLEYVSMGENGSCWSNSHLHWTFLCWDIKCWSLPAQLKVDDCVTVSDVTLVHEVHSFGFLCFYLKLQYLFSKCGGCLIVTEWLNCANPSLMTYSSED